MKNSLHASATQQLKINPKLHQAIHMLQLSTIELNQELHQILEKNLLLELENGLDIPASQLDSDEIKQDNLDVNTEELEAIEVENEYQTTLPAENKHTDILMENFAPPPQTLTEYLLHQLSLLSLTEKQHLIAEVIIDSLTPDGLLKIDFNELKESIACCSHEVDLSEIEQSLKIIQKFEPTGVGARDLQECLLIQLKAYPKSEKLAEIAYKIILENFNLLAQQKYEKLQSIYQLSSSEFKKILDFIKQLKPRPGSEFHNSSADVITPDIIVHKTKQSWKIKLNDLIIPKLSINKNYEVLLNKENSNNSSSYQFLQNHFHEAQWIMKCLQTRNDTLLNVARSIMKHQENFLNYGKGAIKPLILHEIADDVGLHPSTISRVTTRKYILTPHGTFELKYFFNAHLATTFGTQCSVKAIQTFIQEMIKKESVIKPLSDEKISQLLSTQGVQIARRTVTKYRELLAIPPAHERKIRSA